MRLPTGRAAFAASAAATVMLLTAACGGDTEAAAESTSDSAATSEAPADPNATFQNGTYEASGTYGNPGGQSSIDVTMTIADNVVTDLQLEPEAVGTSLQYQKQFIGGAAAEVVGKSLGEINVSKVSGSSLTSQGFNQALEQIRKDAAA